MTDRQRNGFVLLLVAGLIAASAVVLATKKTFLGLDLKGGVELVYQGEPTPQTPKVTPEALNRAVDIMRQRVDQLGVSQPSIQTTGTDLITVGLPDVKDTARAEAQVGATARLLFYDWEANALAPNGKPVSSLLLAKDPTASTISQGTTGAAPGSPGVGSLPLYQAVKLAAAQKNPPVGTFNARNGPAYFMFGAPGSAACQAAGRFYGFTPDAGQRCLLSGPDTSLADLTSGLPPGVSASQGQVLTVPQGIVVLQAVPASFAHPPKITNPSSQFYVLLDRVALLGSDITNPQQSTDSAGAPDVSFGFTAKGNT
ncbi:MAG: hypothetical protein M3Z06_07365, partial [Actinomycetota bacterium]|nr:hypothetical protein [Actinomycetota bacterium]